MGKNWNTKESAFEYAARRAQAQRSVKSHITEILSSAASDIADKASIIRLTSNKGMFMQFVSSIASGILDEANKKIEDYIISYSKASIKVLGDKDTGATTRLLNGELFGKTFTERNNRYIKYFSDDVANIILACRKLSVDATNTKKAILSYFQDPYSSDIINKANKKGANVQTPSYRRGIYHSAYQNIVRNAQGTIAIAWGREAKNFAKRNGAIGFRVHRGSSYPCDICDHEVSKGTHPMSDQPGPYHSRCVCVIEYVY